MGPFSDLSAEGFRGVAVALVIPAVAVVGHEAELIFTLLATAIVNLTDFVPMFGVISGQAVVNRQHKITKTLIR